MMWLGAIVACASLWLLGALALDALDARARDASLDIASSIAAGAAIVAGLGTLFIVTGPGVSLMPFYVVLLVLAVLRIRARSFRLPRPTMPRDRVATACLACAALVLGLIGAASLHDRLWWDGWAIWTLKARVLFLDGTLPSAFFSDAWAFTHFDYPLAVPLIDWWAWRHAGVAAPQVASFVGAVWFALLALVTWGSLRERAGARVAALSALGMSLFWPIAWYATGGTADVVVALGLFGAIVELERGLAAGARDALIRCAAYLTLAVLAKNEGLAIAIIVGAVATGATLRARMPIVRLAPLVAPFVALAPWWLFASRLDAHAPVMDPAAAAHVIERVPVVFAHAGSLLASIPWLPVPLLLIPALGATVRSRKLSAGWLVLGLYLCVIAAVYLLTPHDLDWLLTTSLPRVLSVFVPALIYLSVVATHDGTAVADADADAVRALEVPA